MAALAMALSLGACGDLIPHPGLIGRAVDSHPPPVAVVKGGPSGTLIGGPASDTVPDTAVDRAVASGLQQWLTFKERQALAVASQRAAVAPAATVIGWQAYDGGDGVTATGTASAVGDVYRSLRGNICRDVRQDFQKQGVLHSETVMLCREGLAAGVVLWLGGAG